MTTLKKVATFTNDKFPCEGSSCPTVFSDSNGNLYIQGNKVDHDIQSAIMPASHETVVCIPSELIESYISTL